MLPEASRINKILVVLGISTFFWLKAGTHPKPKENKKIKILDAG
jgi:hypothetical protein